MKDDSDIGFEQEGQTSQDEGVDQELLGDNFDSNSKYVVKMTEKPADEHRDRFSSEEHALNTEVCAAIAGRSPEFEAIRECADYRFRVSNYRYIGSALGRCGNT